MTDASANGKHHYVHQEDNVLTRVDVFGDDDDVLISVTFDGDHYPHSGEVFSMDQVRFLHDRLGRILDDDR